MPCLYSEQRAISAAWEHVSLSSGASQARFPAHPGRPSQHPASSSCSFLKGLVKGNWKEHQSEHSWEGAIGSFFPVPAACCSLKIKIVCTSSVTQGCHWSDAFLEVKVLFWCMVQVEILCRQWMWLQPQGLISDLVCFLLPLFLSTPVCQVSRQKLKCSKGKRCRDLPDWISVLCPAKLAHLAFSNVPQCMDFGGWKSLNCLSLGLQGAELQMGDSGSSAAQTKVKTVECLWMGCLLERHR